MRAERLWFLKIRRQTLAFGPFGGGVLAGDVTLGSASPQAMLIEPTCRLAPAVQARYYLAIHVHHLALLVDPETGARVVHERCTPSRVEWRSLDLVLGCGLAEIQVRAGIHERVVPLYCCLQDCSIHRFCLIRVLDGGG